ncbi:hypothetical protein FNH13_15550 [Ornithinimicrobium ciconiae]|uniref:Uncharacterized protein n=1 Tax=Ornithinimicrobium ciconiae TaxID=2594265 RepID=A0A516GDI9_9MICO|nr:hypothetical protein [Ornithinimicrobium ciconiae]QDO89571.1 hypothetical protein FNH13_15550 [Ornithinimicrobium ciconiae]
MTDDPNRAVQVFLAAIAAITGQQPSVVASVFESAQAEVPKVARAGSTAVDRFIDQISTRLGLAPRVTAEEAITHRDVLALSIGEIEDLTHRDLHALSFALRHVTEVVPTLDRDQVAFPPLPAHQTAMWRILLDLEQTDLPWVLVGGQMTMLHCLENGIVPPRTTDDGDIALNVWVRRDALRRTSRFLHDRGFTEDKTSDGYGYRFRREEKTLIDVLLPEGIDRQDSHPTTISGRPGVSVEGMNQALSRAERVPVTIAGVDGHIRRPDLLGAIVLKAAAYVIDSRDVERHAQDIVALTEIALQDPRATLSRVTPHDRRRLRPFVNKLTADHRYRRQAADREAVHRFLIRFVDEPT